MSIVNIVRKKRRDRVIFVYFVSLRIDFCSKEMKFASASVHVSIPCNEANID